MHDTPKGLVIVILTVMTLNQKLDPTRGIRVYILPTITTYLNLSNQKGFPI